MKTPRTDRCGEFFVPRRGRRYPPQVLSLRRIMNRPGNQAASWRDDAGGRSCRVGRTFSQGLRLAPFQKGAPRSGGGSGFPRGSIPPLRCARQLLLSKGRLRRRTCPARARAESRPSAPGGDPRGRLSRLPASFARLCALGRLPLQGLVFGGQSFSSSLMLFGTTGPACGFRVTKNSPGH